MWFGEKIDERGQIVLIEVRLRSAFNAESSECYKYEGDGSVEHRQSLLTIPCFSKVKHVPHSLTLAHHDHRLRSYTRT